MHMNDLEEIRHELNTSTIKEANGIDSSKSITKALQLLCSGAKPESANKDNIKRWQYGLSSTKNPDLQHDLIKLKEFVKDFDNHSEENIFDKIATAITAIDADIPPAKSISAEADEISEQYVDTIFTQTFNSHIFAERKDHLCKLCNRYADILTKMTKDGVTMDAIAVLSECMVLVILSDIDYTESLYKKEPV